MTAPVDRTSRKTVNFKDSEVVIGSILSEHGNSTTKSSESYEFPEIIE
jgi:hypothetical protein